MGAKKLNDVQQYENLVNEALRPFLNWSRIAVCDETQPPEVIALALESGFTHICQASHPYFAADLSTAAVMLQDMSAFVNFPMSAILSPLDVTASAEKKHSLYFCEFDQIRQKANILDGVRQVLTTKNVSASILTDVLSIADELSTNAIFNAPFVDMANTQPGASREDQSVRMHPGKRANIFLGADATRLVIGCKDPYGTLNLMKLFERVKRCYETSVADNMNKSTTGGAGIGSFMVFMSSASYYAVVKEGICTMICCVVPVKMSSRMRSELPKNLHFIISK